MNVYNDDDLIWQTYCELEKEKYKGSTLNILAQVFNNFIDFANIFPCHEKNFRRYYMNKTRHMSILLLSINFLLLLIFSLFLTKSGMRFLRIPADQYDRDYYPLVLQTGTWILFNFFVLLFFLINGLNPRVFTKKIHISWDTIWGNIGYAVLFSRIYILVSRVSNYKFDGSCLDSEYLGTGPSGSDYYVFLQFIIETVETLVWCMLPFSWRWTVYFSLTGLVGQLFKIGTCLHLVNFGSELRWVPSLVLSSIVNTYAFLIILPLVVFEMTIKHSFDHIQRQKRSWEERRKFVDLLCAELKVPLQYFLHTGRALEEDAQHLLERRIPELAGPKKKLTECIKNVSFLVDDLLLLVKIEENRYKSKLTDPISLLPLAENILGTTLSRQPHIDKQQVRLAIRLGSNQPGGPSVSTDSTALSLLMRNLFSFSLQRLVHKLQEDSQEALPSRHDASPKTYIDIKVNLLRSSNQDDPQGGTIELRVTFEQGLIPIPPMDRSAHVSSKLKSALTPLTICRKVALACGGDFKQGDDYVSIQLYCILPLNLPLNDSQSINLSQSIHLNRDGDLQVGDIESLSDGSVDDDIVMDDTDLVTKNLKSSYHSSHSVTGIVRAILAIEDSMLVSMLWRSLMDVNIITERKLPRELDQLVLSDMNRRDGGAEILIFVSEVAHYELLRRKGFRGRVVFVSAEVNYLDEAVTSKFDFALPLPYLEKDLLRLSDWILSSEVDNLQAQMGNSPGYVPPATKPSTSQSSVEVKEVKQQLSLRSFAQRKSRTEIRPSPLNTSLMDSQLDTKPSVKPTIKPSIKSTRHPIRRFHGFMISLWQLVCSPIWLLKKVWGFITKIDMVTTYTDKLGALKLPAYVGPLFYKWLVLNPTKSFIHFKNFPSIYYYVQVLFLVFYFNTMQKRVFFVYAMILVSWILRENIYRDLLCKKVSMTILLQVFGHIVFLVNLVIFIMIVKNNPVNAERSHATLLTPDEFAHQSFGNFNGANAIALLIRLPTTLNTFLYFIPYPLLLYITLIDCLREVYIIRAILKFLLPRQIVNALTLVILGAFIFLLVLFYNYHNMLREEFIKLYEFLEMKIFLERCLVKCEQDIRWPLLASLEAKNRMLSILTRSSMKHSLKLEGFFFRKIQPLHFSEVLISEILQMLKLGNSGEFHREGPDQSVTPPCATTSATTLSAMTASSSFKIWPSWRKDSSRASSDVAPLPLTEGSMIHLLHPLVRSLASQFAIATDDLLVRVFCDIDNELALVRLDKKLFVSVLSNAMINAIKNIKRAITQEHHKQSLVHEILIIIRPRKGSKHSQAGVRMKITDVRQMEVTLLDTGGCVETIPSMRNYGIALDNANVNAKAKAISRQRRRSQSGNQMDDQIGRNSQHADDSSLLDGMAEEEPASQHSSSFGHNICRDIVFSIQRDAVFETKATRHDYYGHQHRFRFPYQLGPDSYLAAKYRSHADEEAGVGLLACDGDFDHKWKFVKTLGRIQQKLLDAAVLDGDGLTGRFNWKQISQLKIQEHCRNMLVLTSVFDEAGDKYAALRDALEPQGWKCDVFYSNGLPEWELVMAAECIIIDTSLSRHTDADPLELVLQYRVWGYRNLLVVVCGDPTEVGRIQSRGYLNDVCPIDRVLLKADLDSQMEAIPLASESKVLENMFSLPLL